jgi:hypothetical protein
MDVFVLVGSMTVVGPVVGFVPMRERVQTPLLRTMDWHENATRMFTVLLVLGVVVADQGVRVLT